MRKSLERCTNTIHTAICIALTYRLFNWQYISLSLVAVFMPQTALEFRSSFIDFKSLISKFVASVQHKHTKQNISKLNNFCLIICENMQKEAKAFCLSSYLNVEKQFYFDHECAYDVLFQSSCFKNDGTQTILAHSIETSTEKNCFKFNL